MDSMTQIPWTRLTTAAALCRSVHDTNGLKSALGDPALIPYNQADPDKSPVWWIFPAGRKPTDVWPAHHMAKLVFDRGDGEVRAGVQFEKGYHADAAKAAGCGQREVLQPVWAWFELLRDLESGAFAATLGEVAERADLVVHIDVDATHKLEHGGLRTPETSYRFVFIPADGSVDLVEFRKKQLVVDGLERVRNLSALREALVRATERQPFTWLDLVIRCGIAAPGEATAQPGPEWTAVDVWDRVLAPMARWVKR